MMGWGCWRVLLGGNEVDGDMAAQLDMMVGADGGENGAGQGQEGSTPVSGEKMAALRSFCCGEQNWIRAWRYCWTGREGEEKSAQDYRWKEMHRDICTCWTG